jgi:DNA-binding NarL/FixJ family response regulator
MLLLKAQDGREAISLSEKLHPDLILMDITMPVVNGIDASKEILRNNPLIKILIVSLHSNKQYVEDSFNAGALGYLLKNCAISEIFTAIKTIVDGQKYISPDIKGIVIE